MKRKIIYLKAYLCNNLGDDLFVKNIAYRYPDVVFILNCSKKYQEVFANHSNIKFYPTILRVIDYLSNRVIQKNIVAEIISKSADAFVHIGGSIFIEPENFKKEVYDLPNKNAFTIGANFGPYKTSKFLEYSCDRISKMKDVCFRDIYSYKFFEHMDNVRVAPDVLFGYPSYPDICIGNGVGISVISLDSRSELKGMADKYYNSIANVILLCQEREIPVKLFGFCVSEGDENAISKVLSRIKKQNIETYIYNGNVEKFLNAFNSCEYIIATRFHAMVIGWRFRKKVFPIIYSNKQKNVIDDLNFLGKFWNLLENQYYDANAILNDCQTNCKLENLTHYVKESQKQFVKLDEFIQNI